MDDFGPGQGWLCTGKEQSHLPFELVRVTNDSMCSGVDVEGTFMLHQGAIATVVVVIVQNYEHRCGAVV